MDGKHAWCSEVAEHEEPGWASVKNMCTSINVQRRNANVEEKTQRQLKYAKADGERGRFLATGDI